MIILTSTGLSSPTLISTLSELILEKNLRTASIIVTAHTKKRLNKYVIKARSDLVSAGIHTVWLIDLSQNCLTQLKKSDIIYIAGGNTFTLLQAIHEHNLQQALITIFQKKVVIGVSAGAIILTPTIRIAHEVQPDEYKKVTSFHGLNLVPYEIYPHYELAIEPE